MKIKNVSTGARVIAATGQTVEVGESADVDESLARSLCEQVDVWGKPKNATTTEDKT